MRPFGMPPFDHETKCDNCGARYGVTMHKVTMRDRDSFDCKKCGHRMESWNGSTYPSFWLLDDAAAGGE